MAVCAGCGQPPCGHRESGVPRHPDSSSSGRFSLPRCGGKVAQEVNVSESVGLEPVLFTVMQQGLRSSQSSLHFHVMAVSLCLPVAGGQVIGALHLPI